MRKWLGITNQQFDIVKIVYRLRNRGIQPTPKNIQKEYMQEHKRYLMKPNLFTILRALMQKGVIAKVGQADYSLDQEGIGGIMKEAKNCLDDEMREFERTEKNIEQFFREMTYKREQPDIGYLEERELYDCLAKTVGNAGKFHTVSDFPETAYTPEMTHALGRQTYTETLWKRINDGAINVNILTTLDIDKAFNHAFRAFEDPKTAYRETRTVINRLNTQISKHKNLDIRHSPDPAGIDVAISETREPVQFIMFIRDEHDDIQGGINIKSRKTAANALKTFAKSFQYSTPLSSPQGKKAIKGAIQLLEQKYGILEK